MFEKSTQKLEEARVHFDHLRSASTAQAFRSHFNATVNATRSVWDVLKAEGKHTPEFKEWREAKWAVIASDDLLGRLDRARVGDFHRGQEQVSFGTHIDFLSSESIGPPPVPGAALVIGAEGPAWLVNQGTPRERRVPIRPSAATRFTVGAGLVDPPKHHLGESLPQTDPVTFCQLAIAYFEELLYEAKAKFDKPTG
jgi:hypothetical protein